MRALLMKGNIGENTQRHHRLPGRSIQRGPATPHLTASSASRGKRNLATVCEVTRAARFCHLREMAPPQTTLVRRCRFKQLGNRPTPHSGRVIFWGLAAISAHKFGVRAHRAVRKQQRAQQQNRARCNMRHRTPLKTATAPTFGCPVYAICDAWKLAVGRLSLTPGAKTASNAAKTERSPSKGHFFFSHDDRPPRSQLRQTHRR